jgi:hypothetical protein
MPQSLFFALFSRLGEYSPKSDAPPPKNRLKMPFFPRFWADICQNVTLF